MWKHHAFKVSLSHRRYFPSEFHFNVHFSFTPKTEKKTHTPSTPSNMAAITVTIKIWSLNHNFVWMNAQTELNVQFKITSLFEKMPFQLGFYRYFFSFGRWCNFTLRYPPALCWCRDFSSRFLSPNSLYLMSSDSNEWNIRSLNNENLYIAPCVLCNMQWIVHRAPPTIIVNALFRKFN